MSVNDIDAVAAIHTKVFLRQLASKKWISSNYNAFPRAMLFVAENQENKLLGYIQWLQKSGFRKEAVIELEQIAVLPELQGRGIGTQLIMQSLSAIKDYLSSEQVMLKAIMVTTRIDNTAQDIYAKSLGAKVVATIKNLYSGDEVIMIADQN